jgi:hypothetical protein
MGETPRKKDEMPAGQSPPWPLCEQAQADGVPCFELGRDCEICEHASPLLRKSGQAGRPDDDGPLPISGA